MEETLKETRETDSITITAKALYELLNFSNSFEDFFIKVCEIKLIINKKDLKVLADVLRSFYSKYKTDAITYLIDSIIAEKALPCNNQRSDKKR